MSTSFTLGIAIAKVKALGEGATFYASDLGLAGGTIQGLDINGYIEKTGNTKKYMVNVYDNHYIEAEVFEWRVHDKYAETNGESWKEYVKARREEDFQRFTKNIFETADLLHSMGIV